MLFRSHTDNKLGLWGNASGMMIENRVRTRPALSGDSVHLHRRGQAERKEMWGGAHKGELPRMMAANEGGRSHDCKDQGAALAEAD